MVRVALALTVAAAVAVAPAASAPKSPRDYAAVALNVLPPGEAGSLNPSTSSTDQIALYDGLTARFGGVGMRDLRRYFKPERLGLGGERPRRVERPRGGVRILRDRWDIPHVYGSTRVDVRFGAG